MNATETTSLSVLVEGIAHDTARMQKARHHALAFLEQTLATKTDEYQEKLLGNMNRPFFQRLDLQEDTDLAVAVIIGAIEDEAGTRGSSALAAPQILRRVVHQIVEQI